jgi:hypothetical protein
MKRVLKMFKVLSHHEDKRRSFVLDLNNDINKLDSTQNFKALDL